MRRVADGFLGLLIGAMWFPVGMALGAGFGPPVLGAGFAVGVVVAVVVWVGLDKIT